MMPNVYAQKMIDMMNRTGQPTTTTTTGTTTATAPNEGLDLSGLMMMLMLNGMFKDKNPLASTGVNSDATNELLKNNLSFGMPTNEATASPFSMSTLGTTAAPAGMDVQKILQLLASIKR
jgi:hypothetical protein